VVQGLGRVPHVAKQVVAWDADQTSRLALLEAIVEGLVGQFHDDDKLAIELVNPVDLANEGMADVNDSLEGLALLLGPHRVHIERVEVAIDDLDCLVDAARRFALPDLAEATAAQWLKQPVAGNGFRAWFAHPTHRQVLPSTKG